MKWTVGTRIATGFGLALAIFVAVGAVSYQSTARLIKASDERQHTYETLDALSDVRLALRSIGISLRTYLLSGEDTHFDALKRTQLSLEDPMNRLRQHVADTRPQLQRVDRVRDLLREYTASTNTIAEIRRTRGAAPATQLFLADDTREMQAELGRVLQQLQASEDRIREERSAATEMQTRVAQWTILIGNIVALLLAMLAGYFITRDISGALRRLTQTAERVTAGDLTTTVEVDGRSDEIGHLARALSRMTQSLRGVATTAEQIAMGDLRTTVRPQSDADMLGTAFARMSGDLRAQLSELIEGAGVLSAAASEIVASSSQLAASATESAAAVSETTTTVEEVRQTAELASQKARLVSDASQRAVQTSDSGFASARDVEAGMQRIRRQMELIAASMVQLSEQSRAVGQIIATVEDIAVQSNLLAVNAAIEAAKAGEHGRGFGVVAQEVKSLAEQSRQATGQVRGILGDIQKATAAAALATEEGGKVVEAGARDAEVAGGAIRALSNNVSEAAQAALQIAASSQQQLVGVDQVAGAMENIKEASAQNVISATQLEATARSLNELGHRLKQMVGRYKV